MTKAVKGGPKAASLPPAAEQGSDLGVLKQFLSQAGLVKSGTAAASAASPESEIVMYRRKLFEDILGAMQGTQEQTERLQKEQQQYRATLE